MSYLKVEDINTKNCPLEGSELFGSTKRKLDLPPGSNYDSRHPNKVNYSIPHPNTMSMRVRIDKSFKHDEDVVSPTTTVLELEIPESQWYISQKGCQALHANIGAYRIKSKL